MTRRTYNRGIMLLLMAFCLVALMLPAIAMGNPFLVCDPQTGVDEYELEINGTSVPLFKAEADGSMKYDLRSLGDGDYTVRAKAGNVWGWSDWSDFFSFTKAVPSNPQYLRVSSD